MQLIQLDADNIKLILSGEERRMLHLKSCTGPDLPQGAGREAILTLLSELGRYEAEACSLRIYPRVDGGCEIFITLSAESRDREQDTLCYLPSLSHAMALRIALKRGGFDGESQIFLPIGQKEGCYLRLCGTHAPIEGEFGTMLSIRGRDALPWLGEHCTRLAEP